MIRLSDAQLIVLSKAAEREDGAATRRENMNRAGAAKVGVSLTARKLMREVKAKTGMPVWRVDDGRPIGLVITRAGREALGIGDDEGGKLVRAKAVGAAAQGRTTDQASLRTGSKQALVVEMLGAKTGVTLAALTAATGWLPHTTRAALTGLRKRGFAIERLRDDDGPSIYRIVSGSTASAA
jgi:Protein of unknown function (DUF3489)